MHLKKSCVNFSVAELTQNIRGLISAGQNLQFTPPLTVLQFLFNPDETHSDC